jgi:hypothetical protein
MGGHRLTKAVVVVGAVFWFAGEAAAQGRGGGMRRGGMGQGSAAASTATATSGAITGMTTGQAGGCGNKGGQQTGMVSPSGTTTATTMTDARTAAQFQQIQTALVQITVLQQRQQLTPQQAAQLQLMRQQLNARLAALQQ